MFAKDKRLHLIKNVVTNLKFIKLKVLENFFQVQIYIKRQAEINILIK